MLSRHLTGFLAAALLTTLRATGFGADDQTLLNVSYDPTRELYVAINQSFKTSWQKDHPGTLTIQQSHGGSGKQARQVIDGLDADVVTLALAYDIDAIASKTNLIPTDWQKKFPDNSSPYTSTIVFLVREGNPKGISDWSDLIKDNVSVILSNPKTGGGARWSFLVAWGYALHANHGDQAKARDFVAKLYQHVPVLDSGARGSTISFAQRGLGDVLIGWESEALTATKEFSDQHFKIITPSVSILAEPPVAVVEGVAKRHGTEAVATAYLSYLYTPQAQEIEAQNGYRPRNAAILAKYSERFPAISLFTIDDVFGGWTKAQATYFADGGVFDQIYVAH